MDVKLFALPIRPKFPLAYSSLPLPLLYSPSRLLREPYSSPVKKYSMGEIMERKRTAYDPYQQLIDLRRNVRAEIRQIQDQKLGSSPDVRCLEIERSEYNMIIDSLQELEKRSGIDPMDKLPREIWTSVLKYCMGTRRAWHTFPSVEILLELTLVSRRWRGYILSEPALWSTILLTDHMSDLSMVVPLCLSLSRDLPLTVHVDLPFVGWVEHRSWISQHRSRIESLIMCGLYSVDAQEEKNRCVRQILEYLFPLPNLKRFGDSYETSEEEYDILWILEKFPSINHLPNIILNEAALSSVEELQELITYEDMGEIWPTLRAIRGLSKVSFWDDDEIL
ncbi:hypothetical protein CPB86DRAFT_49360, partial [Serendipita vermifera]